jgi:hypothetical protein
MSPLLRFHSLTVSMPVQGSRPGEAARTEDRHRHLCRSPADEHIAGMLRFTDSELEEQLRKETGKAPISPARFYSFTDVEENTMEQILKARSHPWISQDVPVRGSSTASTPVGSAKCSPTKRP